VGKKLTTMYREQYRADRKVRKKDKQLTKIANDLYEAPIIKLIKNAFKYRKCNNLQNYVGKVLDL
jgi:hypothetical protein